ncbi:GH3 family domain-containing protein [Zavarzinella formosa]|uniref:GH3 family domain-containing protein n=1 Tax=Zavarzinella formosa TaxID=360055 RepID=UPI0003184AF9|nr:GH3 auxin-responsive promoter family protein [Zavarzinella formosa]
MMLDLLLTNPVVRSVANSTMGTLARRRVRKLDAMNVPAVQEQTLLSLVRKAAPTKFGRDHHFDRINNVTDYQSAVPVRTYEDFWTQYWKDVYPKLEGATWPDHIPYYALSSGTTSGATKYIPVSREMLASNRKAGLTTDALYRAGCPKTKVLNGKFFFLGGNTDMKRESNGSLYGDLSAIAAIEVSPMIRAYTFPPMELAGIADWEVKSWKLAEAGAKLPITAISGVPSWMQMLFDRVKQVTGKASIRDVWPNMQLVIHGGTKFDAFRDAFRRELGPDCQFIEVYPCSEGFIATEDPRHKMLRVVPDHGLFYEFIPTSELEDGKLKTDRPVRHTLATLETNQEYAVALTTCAGLFSYMLGDTVSFERKDPPLLRFTGRTKFFLSAFGEHLISEEVDKAVAAAGQATGSYAPLSHVGPVFSTTPNVPGHHRYLVEFSGAVPDLGKFAEALDATLIKLNEDYEAHRKNDLSMLKPEIIPVKPGGFLKWMIAHGKRPPQHKLPQMDNGGELTKSIHQWLKDNGELA